eukprot:1580533-Prymnesium_polylepis.2
MSCTRKILGKDVPDVPKRRSKETDLLVKPKAGMAVIHFPTTTKECMGMVDELALHEGEKAVDPKYILQQFIWSDPLELAMEKFKAAFRLPTTPNPLGLDFEGRVKVKHEQLFGTPESLAHPQLII